MRRLYHFAGAASGRISSSSTDQQISIAEAKRLVKEVLSDHNSRVDLILSARAFDPDFYVFAAVSSNQVANPIVGYFAVNPQTGDVWSTAGNCHRLSSPHLRRMQAGIRRRFKLKDYNQLRAKRPVCDAE